MSYWLYSILFQLLVKTHFEQDFKIMYDNFCQVTNFWEDPYIIISDFLQMSMCPVRGMRVVTNMWCNFWTWRESVESWCLGTPLSDGQPQALITQMSRGLKDVKLSTNSFFHIPKGLLSRGQTDKQRTRKQQRIDIGTTNNATTYAARDRCLRRSWGS